MAHYCVFCEKDFPTFALIRRHKCSPDCPLIDSSFEICEADKENEECFIADKDSVNEDMRDSIEMTHAKSSIDYMTELYADSGNRNSKEMNIMDVNDDSKTDNSSDSMERYLIRSDEHEDNHKDSSEGCDQDESVSVDSDYIYTLDDEEPEMSIQAEVKEADLEVKTVEEDDKEDTTEIEKPGYVYVLEADDIKSNKTQGNLKGEFFKNSEDKIGDDAKRNDNCVEDNVGNYARGNDNSLDDTADSSVDSCGGNTELTSDDSVSWSVDTSVQDQTSFSKTNSQVLGKTNDKLTNGNSDSVKLVGASKRKRKFSLENTISQIFRTKTVHVDKDSRSVTSTENSQDSNLENGVGLEKCFDLSRESNGMSNNCESVQANKVQIRENPNDNGVQEIKSYNLSSSNPVVSKKTSRRKNSFVSRCVNVEVDELDGKTHLFNPKGTPELRSSPQPQAIDFSVTQIPQSKPNMLEHVKSTNVKLEPIDLSVSSISAPPYIKQEQPETPNFGSQAEFLEWMKKYSTNFMNQNLMANFIQFQMWMQTAALNNVENLKNSKSSMKNDLNKNVVMREILTGPLNFSSDLNKNNVNMMMAGQFSNAPKPRAPKTKPFLPKRNTIDPSIRLNMKLAQTHKELDDFPVTKEDGIKNWSLTPSSNGTSGTSLTDFRETKTGQPVQFFVKDNEQVQAIVANLLETGMVKPEEMIIGTEEMKFICRICLQRFFHVEHLTKHIKKRHILKKYQCEQCDRSFHDAGNYRQHMRVHDASDVPFECPECQRKFRHKCTLKVHMRIHTGEKPFQCDVCQASFKISSGLQTHMRKHTGETPYACEFCNLRFKCQSNLKQHLFQHTQARPFTCNICGKSYSRKSIRDSHMLTHLK